MSGYSSIVFTGCNHTVVQFATSAGMVLSPSGAVRGVCRGCARARILAQQKNDTELGDVLIHYKEYLVDMRAIENPNNNFDVRCTIDLEKEMEDLLLVVHDQIDSIIDKEEGLKGAACEEGVNDRTEYILEYVCMLKELEGYKLKGLFRRVAVERCEHLGVGFCYHCIEEIELAVHLQDKRVSVLDVWLAFFLTLISCTPWLLRHH
jgi:hypothetical protein